MRVGLVIVTHESAALVESCLRAVAAQSRRPDRIVVVDNASHDDSCTRVRIVAAALDLTVELIEPRDNLGFAAANNLAVDALEDCDWVALLNPDACPEPAWLQSLLTAAARHPAAATLASRLMRAGAGDVLDGAGDEYHVSGLAWRRGHGQPLSHVAGALVERRVMAACAAAALYRRRDWVDAGGFDRRFFCYIEDVDLGFRLLLRGHECWYVPDAVAHHVGSATTGRASAFAIYHGHRNRVWAFVKNMPGPLLARHLLSHVVASAVGLVWFTVRGRGRVYVAAQRDALRGLSWVWQARREVQKTRTVSVADVGRSLNRESLVTRLLRR